MTRLRKAFCAIFLLVWTHEAGAALVPTLPDPGWKNGASGAYTSINYDYGPRMVASGSNPHVGIDYDIRTGYKAYAVEGGGVTLISAAGDDALTQLPQ